MLLAEGIPAQVTRERRGPKRAGTIAAIALTQQRLAIYALGEPLVDVTWDGGLARELDVTAREDGLRIAFDGEPFGHEDAGRIELWLRIGDAAELLKAIDQRRRSLEPRRRLPVDDDAD